MKNTKRTFKFILMLALPFLILIFINIECAGGAAPEEEWNKTFGGTGQDNARSVRQTTDGGYIVTGYTDSYGAGKTDIWLVKTDSNGIEQWNKTFGGTGWDNANSVRQTTDSGYIMAGRTGSYGAGESDFWLVKTDSNGNEQWNKTFGGTDWDYAHSVQQTTDGGYIMAGGTNSYYPSEPDIWVVKTDSNGNEQWNKKYGETRYNTASSIQQTTDGGYIITGDPSDGYYHFWLIKTDSNGNEQWNKIFDRSIDDYARSVQQTTDGGYIIAGWTDMNGYYCDYDFLIVKTDSNGNEQWNKTFGGIYTELAHSVQQTIDGGYIIAGYTIKWYEMDDSWIVKTDSNGNEQWNKTIGGTKYNRACSVRETAHGGYIIAGVTESYSGGDEDFWLIKISDNWKNEWIGEDSEGGSEVTTVELQEAIRHWLGDIPVRGHIMSSTDLQEIIAIWLSG